MESRYNRRTFLKTAGFATAAGSAALAGLVPASVRAIEPITRNGTAKFKFSLAAYSYRNLLGGDSPEMTMEDFVRDCARMQLEGTEPTSYWFPDPPSREYLLKLKKLAFDLGLAISGTAVNNDFCHPPGEDRDQSIAHVKKWSDHAAVLGAPTIRIFSGYRRNDQTLEEAYKLCVEAIEECCDYSGKQGVYLALENHGGLSVPVESMMRIIKDVKSPWFGINLDTGNFHSDDVYADMARVAPYTVNVQVKLETRGTDGKTVPTDFARLAEILKGAGYRGFIVLERDKVGDAPRVECPKVIERLREAFA